MSEMETRLAEALGDLLDATMPPVAGGDPSDQSRAALQEAREAAARVLLQRAVKTGQLRGVLPDFPTVLSRWREWRRRLPGAISRRRQPRGAASET